MTDIDQLAAYVRATPCPYCGAGPDVPCITRTRSTWETRLRDRSEPLPPWVRTHRKRSRDAASRYARETGQRPETSENDLLQNTVQSWEEASNSQQGTTPLTSDLTNLESDHA